MMGGALGLAVLVSISTARTDSLLGRRNRAGRGAQRRAAGRLRRRRGRALLAAVVGGVFLRPKPMAAPDESGAELAEEPVAA